MGVLCSTSCPGGTPPVSYYDKCAKVRKRYGYTHFFLIACDYEFTDILDDTEWEAAVASGDVVVSPPGILDIPVPTQNTFSVTGCGEEETGVLTYALNFLTYEMNEDLEDEDFFFNVKNNSTSFRLGWWDCYNAFRMEDNWVELLRAWTTGAATIAGDSPGFLFSVIQAPHLQEGEEELRQWSINFQIKTETAIRSAYLPGVAQVLVP